MFGSVCWAAFNAEAHWQNTEMVSLPAISNHQQQLYQPLFDEVFPVFSEQDIAVTLTPQEPALQHYHEMAGVAMQRQSIYPNLLSWVEQGAPNWEQCLRDSSNPYNCSARQLLAHSPQTPYAFIPSAYKLPCSQQAFPPLSIVKKVNDKSYGAELCHLAQVPSVSHVVRDKLPLKKLMLSYSLPFVIKEPFGVSGKGSILITNDIHRKRILEYLLRQIANGFTLDLVIEPWLEKELDFSSQWFLPKSGSPQLLGLSHVNNIGMKFSGISHPSKQLTELIEKQKYYEIIVPLLHKMQLEGYFGPVCIDSMLLTDGNIYPVVEINARESMGSIAHRWFGRVEADHTMVFSSLNISFEQPLCIEYILADLEKEKILYCPERNTGFLPLSSQPLLMPTYGKKTIGRIFALYPRSQQNIILDVLSTALRNQDARLL